MSLLRHHLGAIFRGIHAVHDLCQTFCHAWNCIFINITKFLRGRLMILMKIFHQVQLIFHLPLQYLCSQTTLTGERHGRLLLPQRSTYVPLRHQTALMHSGPWEKVNPNFVIHAIFDKVTGDSHAIAHDANVFQIGNRRDLLFLSGHFHHQSIFTCS